MMDIKSKIASYEAHNEAIRTSTVKVPQNNQADPEATGSTPGRTSTSMASHSRRERLQREVNDSPLRQSSPQQQAQLPPGSLAERRRARQLQKQKRLVREGWASPASAAAKTESSIRSASMTSSIGSDRRSSARPRRTPEMNGEMTSNRRFVHSISMESSNSYEEHADEKGMEDVQLSPDRRLSPAKAAKMHRMHRRKLQQEGRLLPEQALPQMPEYEQNPLNVSPGEAPTDDEVTLTSVRQIMQPEGDPISRTASSSTIETDGDHRQWVDGDHRHMAPTNTQAFLTRSALGGAGDEKTFDYGERDDGDDASVTYEQRKEAERRRAMEAKRPNNGFVDKTTSPLLNTEDVSYFRQNLDTPAAKITAGIVAAGTVGCIVLGPVGLLVGAAAVGIGVGVMQIPEEQRAHVKDKAVEAVHKAQESAVNASEALSSSCAAGCHELGVADAFPSDVKEFFENPTTKTGANEEGSMTDGIDRAKSADNGPSSGVSVEGRKQTKLANQSPSKMGQRRAACLRKSRIVPLDQIHSLEPSLQPRAWLDVMASANTTRDEKNEGMEEILILAKDKKHARFFLEEGILDSIMWIITQFLDGGVGRSEDPEAYAHAKLAAACCVTLGKAHCAAMHTGGDLQLMSMYGERGTVPEERQLAQMLYENPHHVQVALSPTEEVFILKQIPMAQAEELASSIKALAESQTPTS